MSMENVFIILDIIIVSALSLSIVYTAGIVWRVERELDISYKFFLCAVVFLFFAEVLDLYYAIDNVVKIALLVKILRSLFAVCFLLGILFMRDIVRKLDGEKK